MKDKYKKNCLVCSKPVKFSGYKYAYKFCEKCIELGWHTTYPEKPYILRTLEEELKICPHAGANRFNKIRAWARLLNKDSLHKCEKCGYDKHVEVCHKQSIADFSPKTLLIEINSKKNLLFLCPNCHWEHDNL